MPAGATDSHPSQYSLYWYYPAKHQYNPNVWMGTAFYHLFPFLEQQNLVNAIKARGHAGTGSYGPSGRGDPKHVYYFCKLTIKTLECPADPGVGSGTMIQTYSYVSGGQNMTAKIPRGVSSYACNGFAFGTGTITSKPGTYPPIASFVGLGSVSSGIGAENTPLMAYNRIPASFPDGMSNTILFTEKLSICTQNSVGATSGTFWATNGDTGTTPFTPIVGITGFPSYPLFQVSQSTCTNSLLPSSAHTAAIITGLADGSVRNVSQGISQTTWWLALLPNDGYPMPSDW
jgi:hypothetical protein